VVSNVKYMTTGTQTYVQVSKRGQIVVPAAYRRTLGIKAGDTLVLRIEEGGMRIITLKRRLEIAQRLVRKYIKPGTSLSDELIAERRAAAKLE
jgi:antitoxin PrlF